MASVLHSRSASALPAHASSNLHRHRHRHLHLHLVCRIGASSSAARVPALRITTNINSNSNSNSSNVIARFRHRGIGIRRRGRRRKSMSRLPVTPESQGQQVIKGMQENDLEKGQQPESSEPMGQFEKEKRRKMFLGVELSPDVTAISMVYFVQGVLGISRLAVSFFLKDNLHLDPAESAVISGFSAAPWLIKPLYGFISDGIPLFGYRRRSYLVLCGLLGAVAWVVMATLVEDKYSAAFAILLSSLSVAFSDVVVDSMAVERARGEAQSTSGSIQSLCWGSSAVGGIVSAYFSGYLIEAYGVRFVFSITSLLPLLTTAVAIFVTEKPLASFSRNNLTAEEKTVTSKTRVALDNAKSNLLVLWKTIKDPTIFLPTIFIFLWQATPTSDTAMFFFSTNKLGFGPEFLGRVRLVTSIASLAGVGLYNGFLKNVPLRKMFFWTTLIGCGLSLTQLVLVTGFNQKLGISNEWFAMGDTLALTVLGQVSFMPVLVLAARICPPGVEATLFATLMSISNGGSVCGGLIGAWVTQLLGITGQNFDNLASLLILCNATSLLPIPLLGLLPSDAEINAETKKQQSFSAETKDN